MIHFPDYNPFLYKTTVFSILCSLSSIWESLPHCPCVDDIFFSLEHTILLKQREIGELLRELDGGPPANRKDHRPLI